MLYDLGRCTKCGKLENLHLLDGKDDGSGDYNLLECIACYGDGYAMLNSDHIRLSIRPEWTLLYQKWIISNPEGEYNAAQKPSVDHA